MELVSSPSQTSTVLPGGYDDSNQQTSDGGNCLVAIPKPATVLPGGRVLQPFYRENIGEANQQFQIKFVLTSSSSRFLRAASDTMLCSLHVTSERVLNPIHLIGNTKY